MFIKKLPKEFELSRRVGPPNKREGTMKKEYNFSKMKEAPSPFKGKKMSVGINLSTQVINYFKKMSLEMGIPYQKLIDLYLLDCVQKKKKLKMNWGN
jgi:predicted DNA binding CopG/RHH family protein